MSIPEITHAESTEAVARQNSGKMRGGNLFRGLKRVAKAVKSAASSTLDGPAMNDRYGVGQAVSPRQRSMSQQAHVLSPMARVYAEQQQQQAHSRSIDLPRGAAAGNQPAESEDSGGLQDPAMLFNSSRLRRGNTTAAHRSPALSQSSIHSAYAAAPMSYEAPPVGTPHLESALLTARSADAVFGMPGAPLSRPAFSLYPQQPQRDRSMTLPSNGGDRAAPALPPRKSSIMSQPVSPQTPGKINLDISGSPLFKSSVHQREQTTDGHSAGERIHKQAVRNISVADMAGETSADKVSLLLPPPAIGHKQHVMLLGSEGGTSSASLSRVLLAGECDKAHATTVGSDDGTSDVWNSNGRAAIPENDSGVLVDTGAQSKENASGLALSQSPTASQTSLAALQQTRGRLDSLPSPFTFGHSRYSLVNQDGSLNLINYEFEQLDGYQKRLSGSTASLNGSSGGEAKMAERIARRQNSETGWFWGSLASSDPHGRSVSPSARLSRLSFGPVAAAVTGGLESKKTEACGASDSAGASGNRHSKLMRKGKSGKQAETNGAGDLGLLVQGSGGGRAGGHGRNHSTSTTHSAMSAAASSLPRNSESSGGGGRNSSSGASRHANLHQQSYSHVSTPLTLLYRQASDNNPVVDSRLLRPTPGVNPFDQVYHSSIASMSLEQALTLVEGTTTVGDMQSSGSPLTTTPPRHRRMHKRSASVLNETELDDIMIQTAEMCHSIQSAIKLQRASESGLSRWISGALGCLGTAAASDAPNSAEIVKEESQLTESYEAFSAASDDAQAPVSVADSEAALCLTQEFVSADSSPNVPQTDAAEDVECHHRRVPSSSQASSLAMWAAGPEPRHSSSTSFDCAREPDIPEVSESVAVSQDSIEVADPVAVAITPRRDSR
ncbi:hypothetical protein GGF42_006152 [Coemansia sp. RSA 2424]|nr:hypothetical protein GGF42_006152 [Coemansia sp. RSA 2424]